jgi:Flp pilus assembly protein TadD
MEDRLARQRQMVEQHPQNELARFSLGKGLFDLSDFPGALEQFEVALKRKPDWMVVQILIGKCHLSLGRKEAARTAFERARDLAVAQHHEGPLAEMEQMLADLDE